jgi:pyridoxal phosphate enzyme (YggS family)
LVRLVARDSGALYCRTMDPTDIILAIAQRLAQVRADIADSAQKAGRRAEDVRLIAVSKTQPAAYVAAAVQAGQRDFGENTLQDALTKIPQFAGQGLDWHFIGHLQSNKAKLVPGNFAWLHSLDSASLAQRLSRKVAETGAPLQTLIEVNITRDANKHGVLAEALFPLLDELLRVPLPGIALRGLMAIGPYPASDVELRRAFAAVRRLRDDAAQHYPLPGFTELSMGMSGDYAAAIKEGSTMVRIGTAIFGARDDTQ